MTVCRYHLWKAKATDLSSKYFVHTILEKACGCTADGVLTLWWPVALKWFGVAEVACTALENTLLSSSLFPLKPEASFISSSLLNLSQEKGKVKARACFLFGMLLLGGRKTSVGHTAISELVFVLEHFLGIVSLVIKLSKGLITRIKLWSKGLEGIDGVKSPRARLFSVWGAAKRGGSAHGSHWTATFLEFKFNEWSSMNSPEKWLGCDVCSSCVFTD